jgi:hypothetical protein
MFVLFFCFVGWDLNLYNESRGARGREFVDFFMVPRETWTGGIGHHCFILYFLEPFFPVPNNLIFDLVKVDTNTISSVKFVLARSLGYMYKS